MLHYPKIPSSKHCRLGPCVVFEKIDGTNLHWDWDPDFGWHAFGTRRDSFNLTPSGIVEFEAAHENLVGAASLFLGGLAEVFPLRSEALTLFTEYAGDNSFAGQHADELKKLIIIDVQVGGAMLGPEEFVQALGGLPIPRVIYRGKFNGQILEDVFQGKFGVAEGVVVKGGRSPDVWMAKVKTRAYLEKLKSRFGASWEDYWE